MKLAIILFISSLAFSFFLVNPNTKELTQGLLLNSERKILSQLTLEDENHSYKILKVKELKGLSVEVYRYNSEDGSFNLVDSDTLTDTKDAFYVFNNQKLNLFLKDINDDQFPEIVLPTFDKNMTARLTIYSFDIETGKLSKVSVH